MQRRVSAAVTGVDHSAGGGESWDEGGVARRGNLEGGLAEAGLGGGVEILVGRRASALMWERGMRWMAEGRWW